MKFLQFTILLFLVTSCANRLNYKPKGIDEGMGKLAVAALKIEKSKTGFSASLSNFRIVDSMSKNADIQPEKWTENDFVCFVLDKNNRAVDTLILVQPLNPRVEFPDDNGKIGSQVIELQENEVLLRFMYNSRMKYLKVGKADKNLKLISVNTIEITENE